MRDHGGRKRTTRTRRGPRALVGLVAAARFVLVAAAALLALAAAATPAQAGRDEPWGYDRPPPPPDAPPARPGGSPPRHRRGPRGPEALVDRYAERLGLDERTRSEIREIARESRRRGEAIKERLDAAHGEMRRLLARDVPDEAAVMRQAEAISALELEERKMRLRSMIRIRGLLTPEQRAELVRILEEERPRHRRGPRPGAPEPPGP